MNDNPKYNNLNLLNIPRFTIDNLFYLKKIKSKRLNNTEINGYIDYIKKLLNNRIEYYYEKSYGIFITIEKNNIMRGCNGNFELRNNLVEYIIEYTIRTAFNDYRFNSIKKNELNFLKYKINFLHKPEKIYPNNNLNIFDIIKNDIILGIHGITVYFNDNKKSTFIASILKDNFNIKLINLDNWKILENELRKKAGSNKKIIKIERNICNEYNENSKILDNILGGNNNNNLLPFFLLGLGILSKIKL